MFIMHVTLQARCIFLDTRISHHANEYKSNVIKNLPTYLHA